MPSFEINEEFNTLMSAQDLEPQHLLWKTLGLHHEVPHLKPESEVGKLAISLHERRSQASIALFDAREEARILEDNEALPQEGFYQVSRDALDTETHWRYFMNMYCGILRRLGAARYEPEPLRMPYEKVIDKAYEENVDQAKKEFGADATEIIGLLNNVNLSYRIDSGLHFHKLDV